MGIARYDEREYMGWIALGVPEKLRRENGDELDLKATIQGTLETMSMFLWVFPVSWK